MIIEKQELFILGFPENGDKQFLLLYDHPS
jgi:hypothetical protein